MKNLVLVLLLCGCASARPMTSQTLAEVSKCDPAWVQYHTERALTYKLQGPNWYEADTCLSLGEGDCKCFAMVAREALSGCVGYEARIAVLRPLKGALHAVAIYTDHKGQRGFITQSTQKSYPPTTQWGEIIDQIPGGPWE
jgi:predicted transglutaminase-like cysteine proteinase